MRIDGGDPAAARLALLWAVGLLLALPAAAAASPMAIQPLLGPSVGDAEALRNEGKRLYNRREYREAAAVYLRANRADASHPGTYLNLARARLAADELPSACSAYRAYLRFAPKGSDRGRAGRELQLCERRLRAARQPSESPELLASQKAAFFAAMERERYFGEEGATTALRAIVEAGQLDHELYEMAAALHAALVVIGDAVHEEALEVRAISAARLEGGVAAFAWAAAIGPAAEQGIPKSAFLHARAELARASEKQRSLRASDGAEPAAAAEAVVAHLVEATRLLARAIEVAPERGEYKFYRALALYRQGDRSGARAALQRDLPDDLRSQVLGAVSMLGRSPTLAVGEIEQLLFRHRFPEPTR